ncbi:MAG TPA: hypothetical protein PLU66_06545, partial [Trueperaceae bacterium]|nr:hypothetical protein [Trueperaceae bacterium]
MLAALEFGPLPLYLAQRAEPELKRVPLVVADEQRVIHANAAAKRHGITPGMRLEGARMRVTGLEVRSFQEPDLEHAWLALLRDLYDLTPWLESGPRGRVFARIDRAEAQEVALEYDVRAGLATDVETAELAALAANPGTVREVPDTQREGFLARLPLRFLRGVGVSEANLTRLHWLGLTTAADLARWSAPQIRAYLGEEGTAVLAYLHGPRRAELRPYRLPPSIRRSLSFADPVREPHQILPAIDRLATELERALAGRAARRLTLTATLAGTQHRASRLAKRPLQQARHIRQQALFALHDSHAEGSPIERLTVELGSPERSSTQDGLWPQRERRRQALEATLERFPSAPRHLVWRDPHAQAADLAWAWEGYVDERGGYAGADLAERGSTAPRRPGVRP